jgi:hypothetical protein
MDNNPHFTLYNKLKDEGLYTKSYDQFRQQFAGHEKIATLFSAIQADYAGFLSVSGVTVFELAIKDIFIEFALKKNKVFGTFIDSHFEKINGRIKLDDLKKSHIKQFGEKYLKKFNKKLQEGQKILKQVQKLI